MAMTTLEACYAILNLRTTATLTEIRDAYRMLAQRYHPDRNPGSRVAKVRFKEINTAYEMLCVYRSFIAEMPQPQDFQAMPRELAGDRYCNEYA